MSIIETPPEDRLAIQTYISHYDESMIRQAILNEMERGGQVFFVHNKVQTIDFMAGKLRALVPEARFEVAHGQMVEKQLERAMMRFSERRSTSWSARPSSSPDWISLRPTPSSSTKRTGSAWGRSIS